MKLLQIVPEDVVRILAAEAGSDSAAAQVLAEAQEYWDRGSKVRFWITDPPGLACEEGIEFLSTTPQ